MVPVGISTKYAIVFSIIAAVKPVVDQVIALVENTNAQWTTGDKVSLITSAAVAGVTILSRGAQEIARIVQGRSTAVRSAETASRPVR